MHKVLRVRNVQHAYRTGLHYLRKHGAMEDSRNGPVIVAPGPVMTEYARPLERVILDARRDANPFFHLMEAIWMLAGRDDVASLEKYNGRMSSYSDDGVRFNSAYGHRWRHHFARDQIADAIRTLQTDPDTRRCVIQMWDGFRDGVGQSKDFPCNTAVFFRSRRVGSGRRELDMTITNRSNDIIWGAYGANAVHMSVLLEFVAACCGMDVGRMYQLSNNFHAYVDVMDKVGNPSVSESNAYKHMRPTPLFRSWPNVSTNPLQPIEAWWRGDDDDGHWRDRLKQMLTPEGASTLDLVRASWGSWKNKDRDAAMGLARKIPGEDWRRACTEWLQRRRPAIVGSQNG